MKANKKANSDTNKIIDAVHEQAMRGDTKGAEASMNYGLKDDVIASKEAEIRRLGDAAANEADDKKRKALAEAYRKAGQNRSIDKYNMPEDVKAAAAKATKGK